ncbi:hypothetical protein HanRHA438_Chr13g0584091 [Helianthus annuus]|nr:hypothetical protein HanRHA438_Chr13g0584091 [Helianthus annuus]
MGSSRTPYYARHTSRRVVLRSASSCYYLPKSPQQKFGVLAHSLHSLGVQGLVLGLGTGAWVLGKDMDSLKFP